MLWDDIRPFSRYPRELDVSERFFFSDVMPPDARFFYGACGTAGIVIDGKTHTLPEGSAILINAGVPYRFLPTGVHLLAVNFDWTQEHAAWNLPLHPIPIRELTADSDMPERITFEDLPELDRYRIREDAFFAEPMLRRLIRRYDRRAPHLKLASDAELTLLLTEFVAKADGRQAGNFDADAVADYLQENYNKPITNKTVAEHFHFHPNYISAEFRRAFGKPLHRYLLELRIIKAVALLEGGGMSVAEAAEAVGFSGANYFSRYYKKTTGKTPKRRNR